ncbi:centriolar coiled-coil protein of 110 kDa-like [Colossoma macropomum]|uniref:centriolar coiled-coil protein of 110 kDa-like n=1 Tax=Colossoma macropomum TaxID=42526 RepID=UPI001863C26E|nr:centriolar coiled-coil protein of 110 kDa-like [Colossoma macropomum]
MESYEQFFLRSLVRLQSERTYDKNHLTSGQCMDTSLIRFYGRTVLSPMLSEKQRREMAQYRQTAARLEAEKQTQCRNNLLNRVQKILDDRGNAFTVPEPSKPSNNVLTSNHLVTPPEILNKNPGKDLERDVESENKEISLQNLLRRSREYIEKEYGWRGSKVSSKSPVSCTVPSESLSNKENENGSPVRETDGNISCYIQYHSPLSPGQLKTQPFKKPKSVIDPVLGLDSLSGCTSHSQLNTGASLSLRPHRGRPRPVSTGDIIFSYSGRANEPGITAIGRSPEAVLPPGLERRLLELEGLGGSRRASHSGSSPVSERGSFISTPDTGHDLSETAFRRRCHTLDSNLGPPHQSPPIDRSQERVPRFMAGVPQRTPPRRSPPAQLNATFTLASPTSPTSSMLRPNLMNTDLSASSCHIKQQQATEGNCIISTTLDETRTEEVQWRVQAIGEMQRCVKEEQHALQMSLIMAEQEREQQRLQQELEEKERRLRDLGGVCAVVGELGSEWKAASETFSSLSTSCPICPAEISPGCTTPNIGLPSPATSGIMTSSVPPPVYLWGLNRGVNKSRNRLSQVLSPEQQRALCRLSAVAQGFLTRQLLRTEKVKHLRQTVKDTREFISSFHKEAPQKRNTLSEQDLSLQERVRAQLRAALFDIHDIFFEMTLDERLALLQQDRELRTERKLREMEKAKSPKEKMILSAATQKVLDRKKQRVGESPGQTRRMQQKPKSPLTNRSLHRKTQEDRVKRSDGLKKQHSLG